MERDVELDELATRSLLAAVRPYRESRLLEPSEPLVHLAQGSRVGRRDRRRQMRIDLRRVVDEPADGELGVADEEGPDAA